MARDISGDWLQGGVSRHFPRVANRDVGLELSRFNVDVGRSNHTGEIAALDLVRINKNEAPNAKSGKVFWPPVIRRREPDNSHLARLQDVLSSGAEHAHLAVMFGVRLTLLAWLRVKPGNVVADHAIAPKRSTAAIRQPDIGSDRAPAVHQGTNRDTAANVQKRGITSLVRLEVDSAEIHMPVASVMIVDRQVRQARVPALQNLAMNDGRRQRPVAISPGNVVGAKLGRVDMLNQQPQGRPVTHNPARRMAPCSSWSPGKRCSIILWWSPEVTSTSQYSPVIRAPPDNAAP